MENQKKFEKAQKEISIQKLVSEIVSRVNKPKSRLGESHSMLTKQNFSHSRWNRNKGNNYPQRNNSDRHYKDKLHGALN